MKYLLTRGANPNNSTNEGVNCLFVATEKGHVACVQALLEYNAKLDSYRSDNHSALHAAAQYDR